jgi:hypothetical protein
MRGNAAKIDKPGKQVDLASPDNHVIIEIRRRNPPTIVPAKKRHGF